MYKIKTVRMSIFVSLTLKSTFFVIQALTDCFHVGQDYICSLARNLSFHGFKMNFPQQKMSKVSCFRPHALAYHRDIPVP